MHDVSDLFVLAWQEDYHTILTNVSETGLVMTYTRDELESPVTVYDAAVRDGEHLRDIVRGATKYMPVAVSLLTAKAYSLFPLASYHVDGLGSSWPLPASAEGR